MATHSSILAWRISMDRATYSPWGHKELDTTERLSSSSENGVYVPVSLSPQAR